MQLHQRIKNPFLKTYLEYVENTESPRIMHIWAALTGAGACLGRRVYFPFGVANIYPNLYTLLVGPPGMRKTTCIDIIRDRVRESTKVKFTPEDTAGQKQGLIMALEGKEEQTNKEDEALLQAAAIAADISKLGETDLGYVDPRDSHVMFAAADEFGSFIGTNAKDLVTFLIKCYDGKDYDYKTRSGQFTLASPLLSILGGTTPTDIQETFPKSAIGKGFTSRIIFVYANRKYKKVPRPPKLPQDLSKILDATLSRLYYNTDGEVRESERARAMIDNYYDQQITLNDQRFIYYIDRRQIHLLKIAMILCVLRESFTLEVEDLEEAELILSETEVHMSEALGEYGLSPIATAKQNMLEFLQHANGPVSVNILWAVMQRDMKMVDFRNSLTEMVNAGKIDHIKLMGREDAYVYIDPTDVETDEVLDKIAAGE